MKTKQVLLISKIIFICTFGVVPFTKTYSQKVDSMWVYSPSMEKSIKTIVILPENYVLDTTKAYPVIYLLHGYGGNEGSWLKIKPNLPKIASSSGIIFVCTDAQNSWYWDSPAEPSVRFETYVSKELVSFIDKNYNTKSNPKGRAITGLSMGGHGGLWLGIRHQDIFGACGTMSGGVDILPFPDNWQMTKLLGKYVDNPNVWESHSVINQLYKINQKELKIIIDCGTKDFFYEINKRLHEKMLYLNIPHDYIERPGEHNLAYWNNAVDYQILYFAKYFKVYKD